MVVILYSKPTLVAKSHHLLAICLQVNNIYYILDLDSIYCISGYTTNTLWGEGGIDSLPLQLQFQAPLQEEKSSKSCNGAAQGHFKNFFGHLIIINLLEAIRRTISFQRLSVQTDILRKSCCFLYHIYHILKIVMNKKLFCQTKDFFICQVFLQSSS